MFSLLASPFDNDGIFEFVCCRKPSGKMHFRSFSGMSFFLFLFFDATAFVFGFLEMLIKNTKDRAFSSVKKKNHIIMRKGTRTKPGEVSIGGRIVGICITFRISYCRLVLAG